MKTATIPSLRVEPELRESLESLLKKDETLSSFVECAIRDSVRRRQMDAEFHARGLASMARVRAGESTATSEEIVGELECKLAAARVKLAQKQKAKA